MRLTQRTPLSFDAASSSVSVITKGTHDTRIVAGREHRSCGCAPREIDRPRTPRCVIGPLPVQGAAARGCGGEAAPVSAACRIFGRGRASGERVLAGAGRGESVGRAPGTRLRTCLRRGESRGRVCVGRAPGPRCGGRSKGGLSGLPLPHSPSRKAPCVCRPSSPPCVPAVRERQSKETKNPTRHGSQRPWGHRHWVCTTI